MELRAERVVVETDRYRIVGDVMLPREGYRSRLSDYLNRGDVEFIPMTNAQLNSLNGGAPEDREFIAVGRKHIHLAYPFYDEQ